MSWLSYLVIGLVAAVALYLAFYLGILYRRKIGEAKITSAETQAAKIISEAKVHAEQKRKEALIEAKEEILRNKNEAERELKERRNEISRLEKRAIQKEENFDRKLENLEKKEEVLNRRLRECDAHEAEIADIKEKQIKILEEYAGLTSEQAKAFLLKKIEGEVRHEAALKIAEVEQELKETADEKAKNIISLAIQRCASSYVAEATVSVVVLPN
ncbi:MAG TPA: ribonuclease Y, partial [Clostridiales bacterium]|nr:ribonuclease Y [Clostridiales bacterium]